MTPQTIYRSEAARIAIEELYERARARLSFPTASTRVETRLGSTHVLVAGPPDRPPVVVLQGGNVVNPLTLAWLTPLVGDFRIYAPDTIGQPGKSAGRHVSANDASLGEWSEDVLGALGLESARFIAISYGAGTLLRLAAHRPEMIERAVLVVPAGLAGVPVRSMLGLAAGYIGFRAVRRRGIVEWTVRQLAGPNADPLMTESTTLAFTGTHLDTEMPRNATPDELRDWSAPVAVFVGEHDPLFPPDRILPAARAAIPNLQVAEILPGLPAHPHRCLRDGTLRPNLCVLLREHGERRAGLAGSQARQASKPRALRAEAPEAAEVGVEGDERRVVLRGAASRRAGASGGRCGRCCRRA
jgi:pimeloyl-ACP methyl ester carboxylesterase